MPVWNLWWALKDSNWGPPRYEGCASWSPKRPTKTPEARKEKD
jgi:hypothetical protein